MHSEFLTIVFWTSIVAIFYAYFGYPLLLVLIARLRNQPVKKEECYPFVTMVIAAHNEESGIREKLHNALAMDYPRDKFEIIVASDASTDKTNEIVQSFANQGVRLLALAEHHGKTVAQNEAVRIAGGDVVLFSDATTAYEPQLLRKIVRNFADSSVGAVGGELVYVNKANASVGEGNGLYWEYEKFLKKQESEATSLIGVSGCCYAVRKNLYEPIASDLISDFVIAQMVYQKGKRVVYEAEAISYEETTSTSQEEFQMRVRVSLRTLWGLWRMRAVLNPFRYGFFALQLISHKIMRYLVPIFMIVAFIVNIAIADSTHAAFYELLLLVQVAFYVFALLGWFTRAHKHLAIMYVPFYFCVTNLALFLGIIQFLQGKKQVVWKPLRN